MSSHSSEDPPQSVPSQPSMPVPFLSLEAYKRHLDALHIHYTILSKSDKLNPEISLPDDAIAISHQFESCVGVYLGRSKGYALHVAVCWLPAKTEKNHHACEESLIPETVEIKINLHDTPQNLRYCTDLQMFVVSRIQRQPRTWIDFLEINSIGKRIKWPERLQESESIQATVKCKVACLRDTHLTFCLNICDVANSKVPAQPDQHWGTTFQAQFSYPQVTNAGRIAEAISFLNQNITVGYFVHDRDKMTLTFVDRIPLHCIAEESRQEVLTSYFCSAWEAAAWVVKCMRELEHCCSKLINKVVNCMALELKNTDRGEWIELDRERCEFEPLQTVIENLNSLSREFNDPNQSSYIASSDFTFIRTDCNFESMLNNQTSEKRLQSYPAIASICNTLKSIRIFPANLVLRHKRNRINKVYIAPADHNIFNIDDIAEFQSNIMQNMRENGDFRAVESLLQVSEEEGFIVEGKIEVGSGFCPRISGKIDIERRDFSRCYCNKVQCICLKLPSIADENQVRKDLGVYISHSVIARQRYSRCIQLIRYAEELYLVEPYCKEEKKAWDLKGMLKITSQLRCLHSEGNFHWFLSPLTIRQHPDVHFTFPCILSSNAHFLSPLVSDFADYQAPEVRGFIETWKVVEDPQAADVYSLCALLSSSLARSVPLVANGLHPNPRKRPKIGEIEQALKAELGKTS